MDSPDDPSLPFFAYGMFKPGQIAFFRLKELVRGLPQPTSIKGTLLLRDGLPIVDPQGEHSVQGVLLNFQDDKADEAYLRIATLEPDKHYSWGETQVGNARANVLLGRNPRKGSIACEEEWDGWIEQTVRLELKTFVQVANGIPAALVRHRAVCLASIPPGRQSDGKSSPPRVGTGI